MTVFTVREDAGHGWLIVTRAQLADIGLTEADISPFSYADPSSDNLGLEEDMDAITFYHAWLIQNEGVPFESRSELTGSDVRHSWARFGTRVNDASAEQRSRKLRDAANAARHAKLEA